MPGLIDHAQHQGHEVAVAGHFADFPVDRGQRRAQVARAAQQGAAADAGKPRHHQCRRDALAGHVAQEHGQPPAGQTHEVVIVAADHAGGLVKGPEAIALQCRHAARQEGVLNHPGDVQFSPPAGLLHLAAVELGILQRQRHLPRHAVEKLQVRGGEMGLGILPASSSITPSGSSFCDSRGTQRTDRMHDSRMLSVIGTGFSSVRLLLRIARREAIASRTRVAL